jgi:serine/threonine protein kinase/tetratricopeptide (TPR) repeat protein
MPARLLRLALEVGGEGALDMLDVEESSAPADGAADLQKFQQRIPQYTLGKVLGEGGMGTVVLAEERSVRRKVALKVLKSRSTAAARLRFIEEAQVTAQLEHPNIVPIHYISADGRTPPYYTMKLVRGLSLASVLEQLAREGGHSKKYSLGALLTLFQKVADAVAFAHSRGVIHRDLKPANIMLGDFGEVLVTDWGLAKLLHQSPDHRRDSGRACISGEAETGDADTTGAQLLTDIDISSDRLAYGAAFSTLDGAVMGTPEYMAPEQARGEIEGIDERSDIYALGAILFQILTLRPPVTGASAEEIVERVGRVGADPQVGNGIAGSLAAVVQRAMAFDPALRYQTVTELQADISAYQGGFATSAENAGSWRQFTLLVKRHRAASIGAAAVLVTGMILGTTAVGEARRAHRHADAEAAQRRRAEEARSEAERLVRFISGDLRAKLEKVGRLELLKDTAQEVERYYQRFPAGPESWLQQGRNTENQAEVAMAQGRPTEALKWMAKAAVLYRQSAKTAAAPASECQLANALSRLTYFAELLGWQDRAEAAALEVLMLLRDRDPASLSPSQLAQAAAATHGIHRWFQRAGKADSARAALECNERFVNRLHATQPADPSARAARARHLIASLSTGDAESVWRAKITDARAIADTLLSEEPANRVHQTLAAEVEWLTVQHLQYSGYDLEAQQNGQRALAIFERLHKEDPENVNTVISIYAVHSELGYLKKLFGRERSGEAHWAEFARIAETMVQRVPEDQFWRSRLQFALYRLGESQLAFGTPAEALQSLRRSLSIYLEIRQDMPDSYHSRSYHATLLRFISLGEQKRGDLAAALNLANEALELISSSTINGHKDRSTGYLYRHRAGLFSALEQFRKAEGDARAAVVHFAAERKPHFVYIAEFEYARALVAHGDCLIKLQRLTEADALLEEATAVFGRILTSCAHQPQVFAALTDVVRRRFVMPEIRDNAQRRHQLLDGYRTILEDSLAFQPDNQERKSDLLTGLAANARRARQVGDAAYAAAVEKQLADLSR